MSELTNECSRPSRADFDYLDRENAKLREELRIVKSDNETLKNAIIKMVIDKYGV